jgi:hypothetical protein
LPDEEVDSILAEEGEIDMHCDYCGSHYLFNAMDIARSAATPPCRSTGALITVLPEGAYQAYGKTVVGRIRRSRRYPAKTLSATHSLV